MSFKIDSREEIHGFSADLKARILQNLGRSIDVFLFEVAQYNVLSGTYTTGNGLPDGTGAYQNHNIFSLGIHLRVLQIMII